MNGFETAGFAGGTLNPMLNSFEVHDTSNKDVLALRAWNFTH